MGAIPTATGLASGAAHAEPVAVRAAWFLIILAYAVVLTAFHHVATDVWWLASPLRLAAFEAVEPFQHRVLVPAMASAIAHSTTVVGVEVLFALAEVAAWTLLLVVATRALAALGIGSSPLLRRLLAMTLLVPMVMHVIVPDVWVSSVLVVDDGTMELGAWGLNPQYRYVYDLPAAVFTLALVVLLARYARTLQRPWLVAYMALFAVATLNRETTLFLIPAFAAVCYGRLDNRSLFTAVLAQAAVFALIQGSLHWLFADNVNPNASVDGTQYENHLLGNLGLMADLPYLAVYLARFCVGLYIPVLLLHRYLDPTLRLLLLWFGLPLAASVLLFGRMQELRVFVELVPLVWLAAVQVITSWLTCRGDRGRQTAVAADAFTTAGQDVEAGGRATAVARAGRLS